MRTIYLDFNASTPVAPEVRERMAPYLEAHYGNPSAGHWAATPAREAVDAARASVAALIGATPSEIVFTSGGTESNNHVIKGAYFRRALGGRPFHLVTSVTEHPAVLEACAFVERLGARITRLPVDATGRVDPDDVARAIEGDTALVSIMHANNEVGTLAPLAEISEVCRERGVPLHADAAQSLGKIPVDVDELGVDALSIAGHKCYAPKGVGALYLRQAFEVEPLLHGGGHESGRRASTENVAQIAGLGAACALARETLRSSSARMRELRDRFHHALDERPGGVVLNGHPEHRLPNTLNVSFVGKDAASILERIPELALSTGSACHADVREMSPVLKAMGAAEDVGFGAVRISLGRTTTEEEVEAAAVLLRGAFD